jgi:hypothetical protein
VRTPTVLIDLSVIVRFENLNDWKLVEEVVDAWKAQRDSKAVFLGVADNSLRKHLDPYGQTQLTEWTRRGAARSVGFADEEILTLATEYPDTYVITRDGFKDHRRAFPWLQGTRRILTATLEEPQIRFRELDFAPLPEHQVSYHIEDAALKPKGIDESPEARAVLQNEWSCSEVGCTWEPEPVIGEDPRFRNGQVLCPACGKPARKVGRRGMTRELVLSLDGVVAARLPLAEGAELVVGRARGRGRYDVRDLLDAHDADAISRTHLKVTNTAGGLFVEEPGSKNGSEFVPENGPPSRLHAGVLQRLDGGAWVVLANTALSIRVSGRRRPHGSYKPDLATPPWARNDNDNQDG